MMIQYVDIPIRRPEKIAAIPLPAFHPHLGAFHPPTAIPTPMMEETMEYVVETGQESRVAIVNQAS